MRELSANLQRNPVLRAKVAAGFVAPGDLVSMGPQELASQDMDDLAELTVLAGDDTVDGSNSGGRGGGREV